ncbi:MAG: nucleotidyltransferase family protein [Planctomycetes bacterium]|nr:nucleotidyltransferase family protein [Planctomycetota bacterium]
MRNTGNTSLHSLTCQEAVDILQAHLERINSFGVRHLSIFGSVARNACGPESDVDIVVEFAHTTYAHFKGLKAYLEDILGRKVDLVTQPSVKGRFAEEIKGELVDVKTQ